VNPPHFDFISPLYDRVISPPDPALLRGRLRLPIQGRALEVGGGTGRVAAGLRPLVGQFVISDLSEPMLREAHAKCDCGRLQSYAERLPFAEASFERVLVVDALHHFRDQRAAVGEMWRVLKPGGRLVIEEMDVTRLGVKLIALAEKLALMGSRFHTPGELCAMVSSFGAAPQVETDGKSTVWVIADKPPE
jgi:ubiquinone/menaquinone biosynthesis C-methylase UbiE